MAIRAKLFKKLSFITLSKGYPLHIHNLKILMLTDEDN
jgi:hypothetical protein